MEYLTSQELSKILKVSLKTISRWREKGMPAVMIGRIYRYELPIVMEWIEKQK